MLKTKSTSKFILCLFLLLSISFSTTLSSIAQAKTLPIYGLGADNITEGPQTKSTTKNSYLVLVQNKDLSWTAYDNLVVKTSSGTLMVKIYSTSKAVGLKYSKKTSKKFNVSNGKKVLYFTKDTKTYTYYNGKTKTNHNTTYAPYTTKKTNTSPAANVVHYATLGKIVNTKYFAGSKATDYKVNGFNGVIAYSKYKEINNLPDINKVVDTNGDSIVSDTIPNETTTPTSKPNTSKEIIIGNVKVPLLDGFAEPNDTNGGWFGADTDESHPYFDAAGEFSNYIYNEMLSLGEYVEPGIAYVKRQDNYLSISPYGSHTQRQSMSLVKTNNQYELTIKTRFKGHEQATLDQNSLKLLLAAFTNDINGLYNIIYDSMETDETHGLNESTWTNFGDYSIKVDLGTKGQVTYLIKGN